MSTNSSQHLLVFGSIEVELAAAPGQQGSRYLIGPTGIGCMSGIK